MSTTENCTVCGKKIEVQIMKNSGVCGEICRKKRDGEISNEMPTNLMPGMRAEGINPRGIS